MSQPAFQPAGQSRRLVYVFEPDATLRGLLVDVLEVDGGYRVRAFDSIESLKDVAKSRRPSAIVAGWWWASFLDLEAEERRQIGELGSLAPTILISGSAWAAKMTAQELGVTSVLLKPLVFDTLLEDIQKAFE